MCFLSPHDIDALQLVNSAFNSLVETHRCRLPIHMIDILCLDGRIFGSAIITNHSTLPSGSTSSVLCTKKAITLSIDPTRVGCVRRLEYGDNVRPTDRSREVLTQLLIHLLVQQRVPVKCVEIWDEGGKISGRWSFSLNSATPSA